MTTIEQKCGTCNAFKRERGKQGICRARPPIPIIYGMQQSPLQGVGPQAVVMAHFPVLDETQWCRDWQMKTDGEA